MSWYDDPLPTNCVGDWVCPGGTGCGYPVFAHNDGPEYGYQNLANFKWLAQRLSTRPEPPLLIASTLMVPGYIDAHEIALIAGFIASLDPNIPYSLLGFHPDYRMTDLAPTSHELAQSCLDAARQAGLMRVKVGNAHLLW